MENKYFIVRPFINGFETIFIVNGDEESLQEYVKRNINFPCSYVPIQETLALDLYNVLGLKIYMAPHISEVDKNDEIISETD